MPNPNTLYARILIDELARCGLRAACLAPGSRSTPLALAFDAHPAIQVHSLLDERGAAYFALGIALATGQPAAVVCTSGTAAANFYPAVIEAHHAHVPLLLLTADRPPELRGSGANQSVDQVKMYADHLRWFVDLPLPEWKPPPQAIRHLRTLACRAYAAARGVPPGPVHLNLPFRKPLEPTPLPGFEPPPDLLARPGGQPFTRIPPARPLTTLPDLPLPPRGLILCGPRCAGADFPAAVAQLSAATGYPLVADALSGLRLGPHTALAPPLSPLIASRIPAPDLILQFGAAPTSKPLLDFLATLPPTTRRLAVAPYPLWPDPAHTLSDLIVADPAAFCRALIERLPPRAPADPAWVAELRAYDSAYWRAVQRAADEGFFEGLVLPEVVDALPEGGLLFVSSSNPVRHLDEFVPPGGKRLRVFANRGASGIDGVLSTALGVASASDAPLVLVIGDLALYHDLNGLLALRRCGLNPTIVLINNDGGGIFHRLPIASFDPPFTELFLTAHGLDFAPAAAMFAARYTRVTSRRALRQALQTAIPAPTPHLIEVRTDPRHHERVRSKIEMRNA